MSTAAVKPWFVKGCLMAATAFLAGGAGAETITPDDYIKSVKIRFDGYTGTTPLTNFPALIELSDGMHGFHYSEMESDDYSDLRFTQDDGVTSIPFEVEEWNSTAPAAADPAALSGCLLWLKADAGAQTNASGGVTNWLDHSGSGNHAVSQAATVHPALIANAISGQPVVRFSGANDNYVKFPRLTAIRTVLWVIKEDADAANTTRFLLGDQGGSTYQFHRGDNKAIWSNAHAPLMFQGVTELNGSEIDGRTTLMPTGMSVLSVRTYGSATANTLAYDRNINGRSWDGDVAEVIIYNRVLTTGEMLELYTYLEAKYAIEIKTDRKSTVWVQIPELTNNAAIYAYWGNPAATEIPVYSTNGTAWSDNYAGVYHLSEKGGVTAFADSSPHRNNLTSLASPDETGGKIGLNRKFTNNNADQPLRISSPAGALTLDELTVMLWVNVVNGNDWRDWWGIEAGSGNHLRMELDNETPGRCNIFHTNVTGANPIADPAKPVEDGQWHHLVFTASTDANEAKVYVDGVQDGATVAWSAVAAATGLKIGGSWDTYTGSVGGRIDEARFERVARSSDWIKAAYDNQANPAVFSTKTLEYYYDTSPDANLQAGNGSWSTSANTWSTGTDGSNPLKSWEAGAFAIFAESGVSVVTVDSVSAQKLIFNGTGYQLTGGALALDRDGIEANESAAIATSVTLTDAQAWIAASGKTLSVSGPVNSNGQTLTAAGEGTTALSGAISGSGSVLKQGTGTALLDAYHSYTGGTTVDEGVLQLNKGGESGCIRGSISVESAGQLDLLANNSLGWGASRVSSLNINGGLVNNTAAGDNGWAITINMTGGELRSNGGLSSADAASYFSLGGGSTVNTLPSAAAAIISGRITVRDNSGALLTFNTSDGNAEVDLLVTAALTPQGGLGIAKSGPGTMSLTAANTYTGTTRIDNGILLASNPAGSATGTSAVLLNGGVLGGTGTISAAVSVSSRGGFITPGSSIGTLHLAGGVDLTSSGTAGIYVELDSASQYDSLDVTGTVTLGGCSLFGRVIGSVNSSDKFFILINDGAEPVSGTFNGIPEGGSVTIDDHVFTVSYMGDSVSGNLTGGNDVVLYNSGPVTPPAAPYWKKITFGGYTLPTTLNNFPAMVTFQEEMDDFSYTTFLSAVGSDLRFYSDTNKSVELNYEIEQWNTNGTSYLWVQVPALSKDTAIWAYWGDATLATPPAYTTDGSTWASEFAGVWHLNDAGGISTDSTAAGRDGTYNGTTSIPGRIGNARSFAGAHSVTLSASSLASITNAATVSFWQWGGDNAQCTIFGASDSANRRVLQAHLPWDGSIYWDAGNTAYDRINKAAGTAEYKNEWSHWSFTKNASDGTMRIYRNGTLWHSGTGKPRTVYGAVNFRLGSNATGGETYKGSIDEFRLCNVERSADWLQACYLNQSDPIAFTSPRAAAYWDTSSAIGLQSGAAAWDNGVTAGWSTDAVIGSAPVLTWNNGAVDALFTAPGGGTVTVAAGVQAATLLIDKAGYTFTGGSLTLRAGIVANESATIQTPVTLSAPQVWYVATGKTLTIDGPGWSIAHSLVKRGGGKLIFINQRYSYAAATLDIIVEEGEVEFGSNYWNSTNTTDPMRIQVMQGAIFSTPQWTPFGVQNSGAQGSLAQIIFEENSLWNIGGYTSVQNDSYNGEGRIVLRGARTQGGRFLPQTGTAVETRASSIMSLINTEFNGYIAGNWSLIVAEGPAEPDVRISGPINGNVTAITKSGAGTAELTSANSHKGTTITAGKLLINNTTGSGTGTGPVTVNGGTLGGIGIISGAVTFGTNGGSIAPGSATGTLTINNSVDFTSAGAKRFAVTYNEAGDYSTLAVNGAVTLDSAVLEVTVNTAITGIESLFVIVNDGSDAVTGTFAGLPEGALFKVGAQSFSVHYAADSSTGNLTGGNDVLLVSINRGTLLMLR